MIPAGYEPILDKDTIKRYLPNLIEGVNFHFTSEETDIYNCVNWAIEIDTAPKYLFKEDGTEDLSLNGFIEFYRGQGFQETDNINVEENTLKIALYADGEIFLHVARQLHNGSWTSKLGEWEDIEHYNLESLSGKFYGSPKVYMKKKKGI